MYLKNSRRFITRTALNCPTQLLRLRIPNTCTNVLICTTERNHFGSIAKSVAYNKFKNLQYTIKPFKQTQS